jgi:hypothetical protein
MKRYLFASVVAAVVPTVHADWQFTRWGMTSAEVSSAGNGSVTAIPDDKISGRSFPTLRCTLEQDYQAGDMQLNATLCFDSAGKLTKVSVKPKEDVPGRCAVLENELIRKYGTNYVTENSSVSHTLRWQDESRSTDILIYQSKILHNCWINYDAIRNSVSNGL